MEPYALYAILREIVSGLAQKDPYFKPLPEEFNGSLMLNEMGLDIVTLPEVVEELQRRLGGRDLGLSRTMNPSDLNGMNLGEFIAQVQSVFTSKSRSQTIVYVDDEEENLFVFVRKFGKRLNLKTFTDPLEALEFIRHEDSVALVITDEVMPRLSGNQLCDEVHKTKPDMRFILITGNPNSDEDLLYKSLKKNRFYDFI